MSLASARSAIRRRRRTCTDGYSDPAKNLSPRYYKASPGRGQDRSHPGSSRLVVPETQRPSRLGANPCSSSLRLDYKGRQRHGLSPRWFLMLVFCQVENATFRFERSSPDSSGFHLYSSLKVCPVCDRIWAKMKIEGQPTLVHSVPCAQCAWDCIHREGVPGSLLECGTQNRLDESLLEALPRALLEREFELTLKALA